MTDRVRRAIELACVFALGAVLSIAYGSPYGTNNQMTYLLEPLARAFPELYHRDWWVASTHHYEVPFGYATAPLYWLDSDGAVALGAAQLVIMVATFIAIYALVVAVTERRRFEIYAGLAGLLSLGAARALGGTYLFAGYLQPSSLSSLAWIIAMVAWVRERRLVAAVALAIGGVFHINFLVLGIGVFALAELCAGTTSAKKLALLLVPSFVVLLLFSPLLLGSSHAKEGEFGLHVLTRFALTIHFWPKRVRFEVWALAGWLAIAWSLRDTVINTALARLRWFAICSLGCVFVAVWIFSIPPLLTFTRLMVWRMAPFGQLATLLLLIVAVWRISCGEIPRPQRWSAAGLLVGAAAVVYNAFSVPRGDFAYVITFVMVACVAAVVVRKEWIVRGLCALACAYALWAARDGIRSPILFRTTDAEATKWARTTTPVDSLFLAPPYANNFRLLSRRAVVADLKSPPMYLDELAAWYRRICTMVDATDLKNMGEAGTQWDALSAERLVAIAHSFHADYVVLFKDRSKARLVAPLVYEDGGTLIYWVP